LWTLLVDASVVDAPEKGAHLSHTILVTGSDGYAVALSMGEIDPKFEGKSVIIAYAKNGNPLGTEDGLRLIVPGDNHGGRAVRDVVRIEVK
jgi:DMSO/TMAO reductase YedYZ molybdopterin-dependent catalytic subunit